MGKNERKRKQARKEDRRKDAQMRFGTSRRGNPISTNDEIRVTKRTSRPPRRIGLRQAF